MKLLYKKIKYLSILLLSLSCDSYLDVVPKGAKLLQEVEDYRALINGSYGRIAETYLFLDVLTDHMIINQDEENYDYPNYEALYYWDYPRIIIGDPPYENYYRVLYNSQHVIRDFEKKQATPQEKQILGEAYAVRAFIYFDFLNLYSQPFDSATQRTDIAAPLVRFAEIEERYPASTVAEIYDYIFECLEKSKTLLQEEMITDYPRKYRFTKVAVNALLARIHLYRGEMEKALAYAENVLAVNNQLIDYRQAPAGDAKFISPISPGSVEIILALSSREIYAGDPVMPSFLAAPALINLYDRTEDLRFARNFAPWVKASDEPVAPNSPEIFMFTKGRDRGQSNFRTGEIYLLKAEALNRLGRDAQARTTLLALAQTRYTEVGFTAFSTKINALSGAALLEEIYKERERETCIEEHRWFDLRRTTRPALQRAQRPLYNQFYRPLQQNDSRYTLPFPNGARAKNPSLK